MLPQWFWYKKHLSVCSRIRSAVIQMCCSSSVSWQRGLFSSCLSEVLLYLAPEALQGLSWRSLVHVVAVVTFSQTTSHVNVTCRGWSPFLSWLSGEAGMKWMPEVQRDISAARFSFVPCCHRICLVGNDCDICICICWQNEYQLEVLTWRLCIIHTQTHFF